MRIDLEGERVRPDIVFTRQKLAVFVDGCFWHSCPEHGRPPVSNGGYWAPKLARNRERDQRNTAALLAGGWRVMRLWEHVEGGSALAAVEAAIRGETPTSAGVTLATGAPGAPFLR